MRRTSALFFWGLLAALLIPLALGRGAWAYTVYGYEDPLGMLHLSRTKKNDKYKPLYEGSLPTEARIEKHVKKESASGAHDDMPSHTELVKLLEAQAAIDAPQGPYTGFTNLPPPPPSYFKEAIPFSKERSRAWAASKPYPHPGASKAILALIKRYAIANNLDPALVYCVIEQESAFAAHAVSPKGAQGLMQLMPGTQQLLGVRAPFDVETNIKGGSRYLRSLFTMFKKTHLALAAYNAGPKAVIRHQGVPPYAETQDYVARIMARYAYLKGQQVSLASPSREP